MGNDKETDVPACVIDLIKRRKTLKVMGDVEKVAMISEQCAVANDRKVLDAIKAAGWAPFHYDRAAGGIAEPWRAHVLWHNDCRNVASQFHSWFDDCLLYTSPSPRDRQKSRMPSSA